MPEQGRSLDLARVLFVGLIASLCSYGSAWPAPNPAAPTIAGNEALMPPPLPEPLIRNGPSTRAEDGSKVSYSYDSSGRLDAIRDALGQIKRGIYTVDDRPARIDYTSAMNPTPSVVFNYDPDFPRIASMTASTLHSLLCLSACWIARRAEIAERGGMDRVISYQYDALGRVTGRTVSGVTENLQYDARDRAVVHTDPLGQFAMTYLGQTEKITDRTQTSAQNYPAQTSWSHRANSGDRRLAAITNSGLRQFQFTTTPEAVITGITGITEQSQAGP
jgi:YD repeat-containing protein